MPEGQKPKLRELIVRASSDSDFAREVLSNPDAVGAEYNLDQSQIDQIKDLVSQGVFQPAVEAHISLPPYE
jgi:hypothetical protein